MSLNSFFALSPQIELLPLVYGSAEFSLIVRSRILNNSYNCIAVPLPASFQNGITQGISLLPQITLVAQEEIPAENDLPEEEQPQQKYNYVPIDPCQPLVMGMRIAQQENIPVIFIDLELGNFFPGESSFPDTYALKKVSLEKFSTALLPTIVRPKTGTQQDQRVRYLAKKLRELELNYKKILFLCSMQDWPWVREAYQQKFIFLFRGEGNHFPVQLYHPAGNSLYFILGELPFLTYLYEKRRAELVSDQNLSIDGIKELVLEAREHWQKKYNLKKEEHWLTLTQLQIFMQYVRNLSLMEKRLTPDLYSLAMAAKQIGGDSFAISLIETARYYPYQPDNKNQETIQLGIGEAEMPDGEIVRMKNRLAGIMLFWRNLPLKPVPEIRQQKLWKHLWNPYGQCSWPTEDKRIESFNLHVREQAKAIIGEGLIRSEKFTTSVKDGIDLRDTIRHWYEDKIYVKEIPPSRGSIDAVVFIFETNPDSQKFSWRQTWYAEHNAESTLCFYATPYLENTIGPGIAQATYGGCFLLFPARTIMDIWEDPRFEYCRTLEERMIAAACFHSRERQIALVSPKPPLQRWRKIARQYKKNLVFIPLKRFSQQTVSKLRRFHVLNGKQVRSYAGKFIREF